MKATPLPLSCFMASACNDTLSRSWWQHQAEGTACSALLYPPLLLCSPFAHTE